MMRLFMLLCAAAVLSGCASLSYPLPKCDGYARRPLNRSMWQSSDSGPTGPTSATAFAGMTAPAAEPFSHFDIAGSYRSCAGQG